MIDDAELVAAIAQRPHWQLDDQGAAYASPGASAHVRVAVSAYFARKPLLQLRTPTTCTT